MDNGYDYSFPLYIILSVTSKKNAGQSLGAADSSENYICRESYYIYL